MHTNDVHQRLLPAPLAVFDKDFDISQKKLRRIRKVYRMNQSNYHSIQHARRFSHRAKSTAVVVPNPTSDLIDKYPSARRVRIRLVFLHVGEIDTLNEKYQADIYFEARWTEKKLSLNTLNLTSQQQTQLYENSTVKIDQLNPTVHWSPQLHIENAIGQIGEQNRWFTIKKNDSRTIPPSSPLFVNVDICEHRRMKGVFWEKLELSHFPADVQDLTISITSHHHIENCILVQDEQFRSIINREAFADQQEWILYEHVATEMRETKEEYSYEDDNCGIEQKKHPVLSVTCRAARRPGYYYWNGFCLIFLITICSFCIFSISPNLPQSRLQITCTLVLTSIAFRWVVNKSLPQISYLTTLDIYAILSIILLVVLCIWHSIIATIIFYYSDLSKELEPNDIYVVIDRYVFIGVFTIYILIHIGLFIWLIFVPYKRRREMEFLDREYVARKHIQLHSGQSIYESKQELDFRRSSSIFDTLPPIKSLRTMRPSEGVIVIPNISTFIPIEEISNESPTNAQNKDERYYEEVKTNHIINAEQF